MLAYILELIIFELECLAGRKPLYFKNTPHKTIKVIRYTDTLALSFGARLLQSYIHIPLKIGIEVWNYFLLAPYFLPDPLKSASVCVLGMGGGAIALQYQKYFPSYQLTGVEIDPDVIFIARQFFHVPDSVEITCADAITYIENSKNTYDIIICDLFNKHKTIDMVADPAFLANMTQRLTENGIIVINFVGKSTTCAAIKMNFQQLHLSVFTCNLEVSNIKNTVIFASKRAMRVEDLPATSLSDDKDLAVFYGKSRESIKQME